MDYKILVLDIDGTLTNCRNQITPHTMKTLSRVQQKGVKLVIASGRPTYGVMPIAKQLELDKFGGFVLSFNGGKIIDVTTQQVIYQNTLERELIPGFYELAKAAGITLLAYKDEFIITENPEDKYAQHEMYLTKMKPMGVENFVEALDFAPEKCLAVGDPEKVIALEKQVLESFGDRMNAYRSQPFFLELVPKGID
ncbi:MAG: HAD-IIB family hydrolase, partial [Rikenellaceae bacterium]